MGRYQSVIVITAFVILIGLGGYFFFATFLRDDSESVEQARQGLTKIETILESEEAEKQSQTDDKEKPNSLFGFFKNLYSNDVNEQKSTDLAVETKVDSENLDEQTNSHSNTTSGSSNNSEAGVTVSADIDTDNDGLTDAEELALGTNPFDRDSDNDGYSDGQEVANNYDPLSPPDTTDTSDADTSDIQDSETNQTQDQDDGSDGSGDSDTQSSDSDQSDGEGGDEEGDDGDQGSGGDTDPETTPDQELITSSVADYFGFEVSEVDVSIIEYQGTAVVVNTFVIPNNQTSNVILESDGGSWSVIADEDSQGFECSMVDGYGFSVPAIPTCLENGEFIAR
ncbi:MAG: thrombospondin type 3 repeat-containing protein [Patescibacteria group bacterium]